MNAPHGIKRHLRRKFFTGLHVYRQFVGEHVQKHFRITRRIDVTPIKHIEFLLDRIGIRKVAVVGKHNAVGGVHVKRLTFLVGTRAACRRIPYVPDPEVTGEAAHVARSEHVAHEAHRLMHMKDPAVQRTDTRCILPAVLQKQQCIVKPLIYRAVAYQTDYAAHGLSVLKVEKKLWLKKEGSFTKKNPHRIVISPCTSDAFHPPQKEDKAP